MSICHIPYAYAASGSHVVVHMSICHIPYACAARLKKDAFAKTWLMRILINECYAVCRMRKAFIPLEVQAVQEQAAENYTDLYEAIHALPEETGLCVTLHYIEGYKVKEITSIMKLTEDVVKKRLMQGRAQLRTLLEDCEEVAG